MMKKGLSLTCILAAIGIGQAAALSIGDRPLQEIYQASSMVAVVSATAVTARCDSPGCEAAVYRTDLSIESVIKGSAGAAGTTVEVCSVEPIALGRAYTVFIQKTPSWADLARAECSAWVSSDGVFEERAGTFYRIGSPDSARLAASRGEIFLTNAVQVDGFPIMLQQLAETPVGPYAGCDATVADGIVRSGMAGISAAIPGDARERAYATLGARISVMDKASLDCVTDDSIRALAKLWPVKSRSEGTWAAITMRTLGCRAASYLPVLEAALAGAGPEDESRSEKFPLTGYGYVRELRWAIDVMQRCGADAGAGDGSAAKGVPQERVADSVGKSR